MIVLMERTVSLLAVATVEVSADVVVADAGEGRK